MKRHNNFVVRTLLLSLTFFIQPVFATTFQIDPNSDIIGKMEYVIAKQGDTLYTIGRAHDIGMLEMQEANSSIKSEKIKAGTKIIVPSQYILPPGERNGIVINVAELRVYFFPTDRPDIVMTFPLGIGKQGWSTPIGETTIVQKRENPSWTPPPSIRAEAARRGHSLPEVVPAGPNNPLGAYAINLGWTNYRMHGTTAPTSIGLRSSHGCMRMYPEDIDQLFHNVNVGTKVRIIYEPYKLAVNNGKMYLEAHELFPDNYYQINHSDKFSDLKNNILTTQFPNSDKINWEEIRFLVKETNGYPVDVTQPTIIKQMPSKQQVLEKQKSKAKST